jgi:hypothetical protein
MAKLDLLSDESNLATILAALRLFQKEYEDFDDDSIAKVWPDHFTRDDGTLIPSLGTEDIDTLCEALNDPGTTEDCRVCGEHYDLGGDGYDGLCPSCADKANEIAGDDGDWDDGVEKLRERLRSCPKCGASVFTEDAFEDEGEDDEAGRTFYYCSEHCRETH